MGSRRGQSLLLWVGERGAGFWLEGEWERMMDEVLPPGKAGRAGLGCHLPSLEVTAQPKTYKKRTHLAAACEGKEAEVRGHKL